MEGLVLEIKMVIDKFGETRKTAKRILKIIKRLTTLKKKGQKETDEFHNCLKKVGPLIEKVKHPSLNLLAGYHYGLELYLKKQELQEIDEMEDKWERLDKQIDRGKNYYSEIVKATELFSKKLHHLSTALKKQDEVDSILTDESIESEDRFFKIGTLYKKAGMIVQAIKYFELLSNNCQSLEKDDEGLNSDKKFDSHSRIIDIQLTLTELYMKQFRYYDARETLKVVRSQEQSSLLMRHKTRIKKLFKTCEEGIEFWEKRKMEMGNLVKEAEANYGSHLESAYFYFRVKDYERAETAYMKAIEEAKEDNVKDEKHDGSKGMVEACYGLAHTYLAMEDPEKAVDVFDKAIKVDPENPLFYRDLGLISVQNNDFSSAEIFILKAIELAPQTEELYKLLSDLYISQGEQQKATSLYENALVANADNPVIKQDLAVLYKDIIASEERVLD
jgi:tetratricopeptide (TPR) repeat protein